MSGTAISPVANSATDSQAACHASPGRRPACPPGLSIDPASGTITGTPTTGGTSGVTVTATDGAGFSGSATFSWTITNDVTVDQPRPQSSTSGTAISPLTASATDTAVRGHPHLVGHRTAGRLSIDASTGAVSGTPTTGAPRRCVTATDGCRLLRLGDLHLDGDQRRAVVVPGDQTRRLGPGDHSARHGRHRLLVDGHPDLLRHRPPAGLSIDSVDRRDLGHPDDG